MQTFVPYGSNFLRNAQCLDRQRLGKQRVEAHQILELLIIQQEGSLPASKRGWANHPAVRMWEGHEAALAVYGMTMCSVWVTRGYEDNLALQFYALMPVGPLVYPKWINNKNVKNSHQKNLYEKDPDHYAKFVNHGGFWTCCAKCKYYWPTHVGRT